MVVDKDGFEEQAFTPKYETSIWNTKSARAKAGETKIGKIIDIVEDKFKGQDGKERVSPAWVIENPDGKFKTPAHSQLIGKMENAEVGDTVKIEYLGLTELPGGKIGHGYNVGIKKAKK